MIGPCAMPLYVKLNGAPEGFDICNGTIDQSNVLSSLFFAVFHTVLSGSFKEITIV